MPWSISKFEFISKLQLFLDHFLVWERKELNGYNALRKLCVMIMVIVSHLREC